MRITIKDIAKLAGVSPATVSRVIAGNHRISKATTERVKKIMEEQGYHPNRQAQSLVSQSSTTLGIVLPRPADELFLNFFFPELIRGIVTRATRGNYDILLSAGTTESEELAEITRLVRSRRVDGMLLLQSRKHDPIVAFLEKEQFPFVLIGRNAQHPDVLSVDTDNVKAGYDVTNHLISQGHERIGFVSGPPYLTVSEDRLNGFQTALEDAGLPFRPEWIVEGEFLQESGYRAMSFFMSLPERPTALVVIDDVVAFGIMRGLTELGYRVPHDLALAGFNNIPLSALAATPLTSVDIGIYQLGYTAVHQLLTMLSGQAPPSRHIIPHRLVPRESSALRE